jgi:hypothetical protein
MLEAQLAGATEDFTYAEVLEPRIDPDHSFILSLDSRNSWSQSKTFKIKGAAIYSPAGEGWDTSDDHIPGQGSCHSRKRAVQEICTLRLMMLDTPPPRYMVDNTIF